MKHSRYTISVLAMLLLLASVAISDDYTWDQTNDTFSPGSGYGIVSASPIGQEFLPGLNSLGVVQLQICNPTGIAHLVVSIHSDSITGPLLASSGIVSLSGSYDDQVTFLFTPVTLVPATRYVMAVAQIAGDSFVRCANSSSSSYPSGRLILGGTPEDSEDFWFREGILGGAALEGFTWGSIKNFSW